MPRLAMSCCPQSCVIRGREPKCWHALRQSQPHEGFGDVARFEMTKNTETPDYDHLYDILARRMSIRRLKPDPIPDDYVHKILEAGRWAMSGANSQPWEFVVVKDAAIKKRLFRAYIELNNDFIYWMEQQR